METIQITHQNNEDYFENSFNISSGKYHLPIKRIIENIGVKDGKTIGTIEISYKQYKAEYWPKFEAWMIICLLCNEQLNNTDAINETSKISVLS